MVGGWSQPGQQVQGSGGAAAGQSVAVGYAPSAPSNRTWNNKKENRYIHVHVFTQYMQT